MASCFSDGCFSVFPYCSINRIGETIMILLQFKYDKELSV